MWTYVVGTSLATGQQCRLSADGRLLAVSEADNGPDGYTDYVIPVEGGGTTLSLPQGMSGRVYVAIGQKGAGSNRGVLTDTGTQPVADAGAYYRRGVTNHYARVMHENTVDGDAYGFAFDDVCEHAFYLEEQAPTSMTVTITPF